MANTILLGLPMTPKFTPLFCITGITKIVSKVFGLFLTVFTNKVNPVPSKVVKSLMFTLRKNNKIFWSIIIPNSVYVVHVFLRKQISTKFFFHYETTSFNISPIPMGVLSKIQKDISTFLYKSTLPRWTFITSRLCYKFMPMTPNITLGISGKNGFLTTATKAESFNSSWLGKLGFVYSFTPRFSVLNIFPEGIPFLKWHVNNIMTNRGTYVKH